MPKLPRIRIVFLISFVATFVMVLVPHLRAQKTVFVSPYSQPNIMDSVNQKLAARENSYKLKHPTNFIPEAKAASDFEQLEAYSVVDFETGEVLFEKGLSKKLPIASLTKIMTATVALDLASQGEEFEVSENAASQVPTKVMLKPGEKYKLIDLLSFMLMSSANDSAQVVKEGIDKKYGEEVFIKAMNEKAQILGLKNSHFTNPQGFDNPDHFSSVEDLSILSHYALKTYPMIAQIVSSPIMDKTNNGADMRFYLQNWNGLLGVYPGVGGVKTGNTGDAEHTNIVTSQRGDKTLIVTILGAPTVTKRDLWTAQLLDLGFEKTSNLPPINVTEGELKDRYAKWIYFH